MAPSHAHGSAAFPHSSVDVRTRRVLLAAVAAIVVATAVGLVLLWPSAGATDVSDSLGATGKLVNGTIVGVEPKLCAGTPPEAGILCDGNRVEVTSGPTEGDTIILETQADDTSVARLERGDRIVMIYDPTVPDPVPAYAFADFQRSQPMLWLALLFAGAVVALGRWRGVFALAGLGISVVVVLWFVLPAILDGSNPVAVAVVGASAIMLVALYLAHGFNLGTTTAVLGTVASLLLTAGLAALFVELSNFVGISSEEAQFLQISAGQINLEGLLLGGIVIGALGVLDDVTVTQSSAVAELRLANPGYSTMELYRAALRIGRDHIASTVNTLVLAYVGASLPLLILLRQTDRALAELATGEAIATEIVRALVGSIGLVASVPATTALAAVALTRARPADPDPDHPSLAERAGGVWARVRERASSRPERAPGAWEPPARERAWRDDEP